jgi:hypothetical protein
VKTEDEEEESDQPMDASLTASKRGWSAVGSMGEIATKNEV